jgi:hypothetical protein
MTKYERRQFFDRLVELRALYRLRGPDDATVEITIEAAIALAEQRLDEQHDEVQAEQVSPRRS